MLCATQALHIYRSLVSEEKCQNWQKETWDWKEDGETMIQNMVSFCSLQTALHYCQKTHVSHSVDQHGKFK